MYKRQVIPREKVSALVVLGAGARFAAENAAADIQGPDSRITLASTAKLAQLADELALLPIEKLVNCLLYTSRCV